MTLNAVLEIVLTGLAGAACALLLPWLCRRLGAERLKNLWKWVCIAVQAAEQVFGGGTGPQKKAYVQELLSRRGAADDESVDALIEAAVRELT